ncbi:DUF1657 domain-containing protein [Bacillus sonorensis]|uniref:DUF1657 domain-containing protein n=2 Tax=Bacillus sonorensis TaxID=119858 RepID=M5PHR7_9BACI|nr:MULTISPECIES: DUF1657 domain-containing protein [Bacillus]MBS4162302.1 DUF1657 domain-containing protein [Klebsiella pneumoniae]TWK82347.1 hypothetical protein CHCC20335_3390 [Bacillus paralicheniformis]ASB88909.1 hypothetical protein S101395_02401 [Bacillus sonorensis]EME76287.1 hypothetical protein BSONL12_00842 [Bacillus sonorensis L12]MBG9915316.1 hypothetical protein [Bacillus sonorensis]
MTIGAQVKQCLASLKSIEAGLSALALKSRDEEAKRLFHETMMVSEEVMSDLKKRVGELEREEYQYKGF